MEERETRYMEGIVEGDAEDTAEDAAEDRRQNKDGKCNVRMFHVKHSDRQSKGNGNNGDGKDGESGSEDGRGKRCEKKKAGKAGKRTATDLVFVLDRSGSMAGLESDTIGGFNALIEEHKSCEGDATVSTVLFNHETRVLHDRVGIRKVRPLTCDDYRVSGCTALLDAVGGAIRHTLQVHRYLPKKFRPAKTIVVIVTDGMENSSTRYSYKDVKRMIRDCEKKRGWEFLFLGANIDAAAEAGRMGIASSRAATYVSDDCGTGVMYQSVARATCSLRSCASLAEDWASDIEADRAKRAIRG